MITSRLRALQAFFSTKCHLTLRALPAPLVVIPKETQMTFDPTAHSTHNTRAFSDFTPGEVFRAPSRTMTEGVFAAFQAASGDNHPIHYDRAYLKRLGHPDLMAHGYQTLIQAAIGALPWRIRWAKP